MFRVFPAQRAFDRARSSARMHLHEAECIAIGYSFVFEVLDESESSVTLTLSFSFVRSGWVRCACERSVVPMKVVFIILSGFEGQTAEAPFESWVRIGGFQLIVRVQIIIESRGKADWHRERMGSGACITFSPFCKAWR